MARSIDRRQKPAWQKARKPNLLPAKKKTGRKTGFPKKKGEKLS